MQILILAFRNIFRNKRRTLLTLLSIIIGVTAIIILDGYTQYTLWGLRESTINSGLGHIQIASDEKFFLNGSFDPFSFELKNYNKIESELKAIPQIKNFVPSVTFTGTVGLGDKSGVVIVNALPPEASISLFTFRTIVDGRELNKKDTNQIVLGKGVADKLGAKVNDTLTLMSVTKGGGINAADFTVVGICTMGSVDQENIMVYVNLHAAQEFLLMDNVPLMILVLDKTESVPVVLDQIKKMNLKNENKHVVIKSWEDLAYYYKQVLEMYTNNYEIFRIIILIVVIFTIINTMMMTVMERVKEIGTLRAIGSRKSGILFLFITEGGMIGIIGGIGGVALGLLLAFVINNLMGGIYIPPPPGRASGYQAYVTPSTAGLMQDILIAFVVSFVGSIYPAYKAVKLNVAESLRFN